MKNKLGLIVLFLVIWFCSAIPISAQEFYGVAYNYAVNDQAIQDGDIVVLTQQGILRSQEAYAQNILGIATDRPIIAIHAKTPETRSIVKNGEALVNVSAKNGAIKEGDFITSSDIPGVGQKATTAGYVVGIAKQSFGPESATLPNQSQEQGKIVVEINIHFFATNANDLGSVLTRVFRAFTTGVEQDAGAGKVTGIIRFILGAIVLIISFIVAFLFFGHNVKSSIEAMGRNPLAKSTIQFSLVLNLIFTGLVVLIGLFAAFMLIRF